MRVSVQDCLCHSVDSFHKLVGNLRLLGKHVAHDGQADQASVDVLFRSAVLQVGRIFVDLLQIFELGDVRVVEKMKLHQLDTNESELDHEAMQLVTHCLNQLASL